MSLLTIDGRYTPEPNSGCWLWTGAATSGGYGVVSKGPRAAQKTYLAHRVSFAQHKGAIPDGVFVCHRCDTPGCVNPDHLFLGTPRENTRDMIRKGRRKEPSRHNRMRGEDWRAAHDASLPVGENHHGAKLTEEAVRFIRESKLKGTELAEMFGVTPVTLGKARRGITWRCVKE